MSDQVHPAPVIPAENVAEAVLALLLQGDQQATTAIKDLRSIDFPIASHKLIFEAVNSLNVRTIAIDAVTVTHELQLSGALPEAGGAATIARLSTISTIDPDKAQVYVDQLAAWSAHERQKKAVGKLKQAVENHGNINKAMLEVQGSLVATLRTESLVGDLLGGLIHHLKNPPKSGRTGITSGLPEVDEATGGFQNGDLIILAARPSMGKTCLVVNQFGAAAVQDGYPAGIFSLEMGKEKLSARLLSSISKVNFSKIKKANLNQEDWQSITAAADVINKMQMVIDDTPALDINELCARARRMVRDRNVKIIIIDYLQLISCDSKGSDNRQQEVADISKALKALAKELKIPVVALSQLNRELERRGDKRPIASDLRESGAIEQDADVIMFLYREAVYCDDCKKGICGKGHTNDAEIIFAKQRDGELGTIHADFDGSTQRFLQAGAFIKERDVKVKHISKESTATQEVTIRDVKAPPVRRERPLPELKQDAFCYASDFKNRVLSGGSNV